MPRSSAATRLSPEAVVDRLRLYAETGDVAHRNAVVESHMGLAQTIAGDYVERGIDRADLAQVAIIGIVKAANRFDPERGVPFAAYASQLANGEIKRWFRDKGWDVRPPRSLIDLGTRLGTVRTKLAQDLQRTPTVDELAEAVDASPEDVLAAMEAMSAYAADPIVRSGPDGDHEVAAAVSTDDDDLRRSEIRTAVEQLLETLDDDERRIVHLRFWEELSQREIADQVGVSQMQVSRLLRRILRRLRTTEGLIP